MSFTKTKSYNLALSALLLSRQITNADTDTSNEARVLNQFWEDALTSTLQEMDLDSLSESITLELVTELDEGPWKYVYKYPSRCAFLRRLKSCAITDTNRTHISKLTGMYQGQKVIYTNEYAAVGECIPNDVSLDALSSPAGMAVSYKLAFYSAPLIVGKGAKALREEVYQRFLLSINEAQELDKLENFNYDPVHIRSEFVAARLE
jgi:hypothetical protein